MSTLSGLEFLKPKQVNWTNVLYYSFYFTLFSCSCLALILGDGTANYYLNNNYELIICFLLISSIISILNALKTKQIIKPRTEGWLLLSLCVVYYVSVTFTDTGNVNNLIFPIPLIIIYFTAPRFRKRDLKLLLFFFNVYTFILILLGFFQINSNGIKGNLENTGEYSNLLILLVQFSTIPLVYFNWKKHKYLISLCLVNIISVLVICVLNFSRLSIFCVLLVPALFSIKYLSGFLKKTLIISSLILCTILLLLNKSQSTHGRLLVFKIGKELVLKKPMFGYGQGRFLVAYNNEQYQYFYSRRNNMPSEDVRVADNINIPYNEFLYFAIELGLVFSGLILFVFIYYFGKLYHQKTTLEKISFCIILLFLILSIFNYPFHIYHCWLLLFQVLICIRHKEVYLKPAFNKFYLLTGITVALIVLSLNTRLLNSLNKWYSMSKKGKVEYQSLYPVLQNNKLFLYEYAVELYQQNKYISNKEILHKLANIYNNVLTLELKGDNYVALRDIGEAENCYIHANYLIPNRFRIKYKLLVINKYKKNRIRTEFWAREILKTKIKIPSPVVDSIKLYAKNELKIN